MLASMHAIGADNRHQRPNTSRDNCEWRLLHLVALHGRKIKQTARASHLAAETTTRVMIETSCTNRGPTTYVLAHSSAAATAPNSRYRPTNDDIDCSSCGAGCLLTELHREVSTSLTRLAMPAKTLARIVRYSSTMLATAGSVICPVTFDRRCNRRAMDSRRCVGMTRLSGGFPITPCNTTQAAVVGRRTQQPPNRARPMQRALEVTVSGPAACARRRLGGGYGFC